VYLDVLDLDVRELSLVFEERPALGFIFVGRTYGYGLVGVVSFANYIEQESLETATYGPFDAGEFGGGPTKGTGSPATFLFRRHESVLRRVEAGQSFAFTDLAADLRRDIFPLVDERAGIRDVLHGKVIPPIA
jgi:hypothetical protein